MYAVITQVAYGATPSCAALISLHLSKSAAQRSAAREESACARGGGYCGAYVVLAEPDRIRERPTARAAGRYYID